MNLLLILFGMLFSGNANTLDIKGVVFDDAKKMADYHIILNGKEAHLIYNFSSNLKITYYYQRKKQFDLVYAGRYIELVKEGEKVRASKSELKRIFNKLSPTEKLVIRSNLINSSLGPKAVHEYSPEYAAASIWSKASEVYNAFWAWWEGEEEQCTSHLLCQCTDGTIYEDDCPCGTNLHCINIAREICRNEPTPDGGKTKVCSIMSVCVPTCF